MSRVRFNVSSVHPTVNPDTGWGSVSPTICHVDLYRLDMDNTSTPLGSTWVELDGVYEHYTAEVYELVRQKLVERSVVSAPADLELDPLGEVRAIRWQAISAIRDGLETRGFPYLDKWFDSDERAAARMTAAAQAATAAALSGQDFSLSWTTADNTSVSLGRDQILGMMVAFAVYGNELHAKARALRQRIFDADTVQEIAECYWEGIEPAPASVSEGVES